MGFITHQDIDDPEITEAESRVNIAYHGGEEDFSKGFVGGHESFGSWFTSGLSGLLLSQALPEDQEKSLYIKRNAAGLGMSQINETIESLRNLNEIRGLTTEEVDKVKELVRRKGLLEEDLGFVYDNFNGDFDSPMDTEGQSFNDRWGIDDDEVDVFKFIDAIRKHPKYAAGVITGEILKDAPMSVLAWLGLTAKTAKGATAFGTLIDKLNKVQPKILRGLIKTATPIGIGAIGGGLYEASYSKLNESKINWDNVASGTEFGAAFGILGTIGVFAKGIIPEQSVKAGKKIAKAEGSSPSGDISINEAVDALIDAKERAEVSKFSESVMKEHDRRLFPQLTGDDYSIMSRDEAISAGILSKNDKLGIGAFNQVDNKGKQTIIWGEKETKDTFDRLVEAFNTQKVSQIGKGSIADTSPNHLKYLKDKKTYDVFQLAHEKAHVIQNIEGRQYASTQAKEAGANQMAFNELDRVFKEGKYNSADKSAIAAGREMVPYNESKEFLPKDFDEKQRGLKEEEVVPPQEPNSQVMSFLERHKGASSLGAALTAYGLTEGDDAIYTATAAALATLGGPKAYRKLTEVKIPQEVAKARLQAAQTHEGLAVYAKNLEIIGQTLGDRITKRFPGTRGANFLEALEKGKTFNDVEGKSLVKQWKDWMGFLARQGAETGLFQGRGRRLGQIQLVSNYVSHIVRGKVNKDGSVRPLTNKEKEDLIKQEATKIKIKGSSSTVHNIPRRILGTIEDLKAKGYAVVDDPSQVLSIYSQAMARTIHNRKLLGEFKQLDLGTKDSPLPAMFTLDEFNSRVKAGHLKKEDQLHYSEFEHPSLQGYKVHSNLKGILDDHFEVSREGGLNDFAEGLLSLNNSLKRVFVFGSLFHGQALFMSSIYSLGLTGAVKGLFGKGKINKQHSWQDMKLGSGEFNAPAKEAIKAGLQIVNIKRQELVNPGKVELDEFLDKSGGLGVAGKKAFGAIDKVTWEYLHDRYKLAAYLRHKEVLMRKGMDDVTSGKKAAEFANDAFGSLDWNDFATRLYNYSYRNPGTLRSKVATKIAQGLPVNKRRWLNLGLFAPDWTISNIRIVGKTFTGLPEVSKALAHRIAKGDWKSKEAKEVVQAWNMYAAYATRAGFYTSGMWWMMMNLFSDEEPTMEGLGEFWGGDTSGKLNLGGGESMVISKQIAEPIHWVQHPQHTLMNKASIVPKTIMEGMFNKQWFSMKKGFPMGPSIVDMNTGEAHYGKWVLGKMVPIVAKPLMQDDLEWKERFERTFTGFFGFPQYGKPED